MILFLLCSLWYYHCQIANVKGLEPEYMLNHNQSTWPSFKAANDSYVYFLGLFMKPRIESKITDHFQTSAASVLFRIAILLAQRKNMTINGKIPAYLVEETSDLDLIEVIDRTCHALKTDQVLGIIGPEYSTEAKMLVHFGNRVGLPIIGYSTTEAELSDCTIYHTFYRLPPSDEILAQALLKLFRHYKWNSTNVIYQSDSYGDGGFRSLSKKFTDEVKIIRSIRFHGFMSKKVNLQSELKRSSSRIVIVLADENVTNEVINLALEAGDILAPYFLWILTASNSSLKIPNNKNVEKLRGILILRQVPSSIWDSRSQASLLDEALKIWKEYEPDSVPKNKFQIDIYGLYAFDAAWFLMMGYQQLCEQNSSICLSLEDNANCFQSRLVAHQELHSILRTMNFSGITGYIQFHSESNDRIDSCNAHYVIDNIRPESMNRGKLEISVVLQLNGSDLTRNGSDVSQWEETDSCIQWPNNENKPPVDYALMKNVKVNITVVISPPFFMQKPVVDVKEQPIYEGYINDLIKELKEKMGFDFDYNIAPNGTTYDDLIECVSNRSCDIVAADLSMTTTRVKKIDFSVSIYDNAMRLLVRKSKSKTVSPIAFLKPFSPILWVMIIVVIYIPSSLLIWLYEYQMQRQRISRKSLKLICGESFYYTIAALLQQDSQLPMKNFFSCIQTVFLWVTSVIIIALLTSNLTTYFTVQREQSWLQSIDDLKMCRQVACNRIGVLTHSQHEEYFNNEVMDNILMNFYPLKHPSECFTKLLDGDIDVALVDTSIAEYLTQTEYCQLEIVGAPYGKTYFGIGLPKQWPYKDHLDAQILDLRTKGVIDRLLEKYFQQKPCKLSDDDRSTNGYDGGLTILETSGLFIMFGALTCLNFLGFIFQYLFNQYLRHRLLLKRRMY